MSNDEETMKRVRELQPFSASLDLQEKLLAIPEQHERPVRFSQRFMKVAPFGFAAAAAILLYMHLPEKISETPEQTYSREELEVARRELVLTFHYLSDVSLQAGESVNHVVVDSSTRIIYKGMLYPIIDEAEKQNAESGELQ